MGKLLQQAKQQSIIKRINTRISAIARIFGTNSSTYKNTIAPFLNDNYKNVTHRTKKGILQFDTGKKKISTVESKKAIAIAQRTVKTKTELLSNAEGETEEQKIKAVNKMNDIETQFKKHIDFLYENIKDKFTDSELQKELPQLYRSSGKISYDDMKEIESKISELATDTLTEEEYNTIFGG